MTDIVERLLVCAKYDPDQAEAANEITRLTAEVERLRAALDEAQQAFALERYNAERLRVALEEIIQDSFSVYAIQVARAALSGDKQ